MNIPINTPQPVWLRWHEGSQTLTLTVHIQPGAKQTKIEGAYGDALKIRLAAPPVDGKANQALVRFLAQLCARPLRNVTLLTGLTSRRKMIAIEGLTKIPTELFAGIRLP